MLEANEALLEQHGLCVVPRLTGELPQLHLCCFTPRYGLSFSDPDVQLAANLALFDGPSAPERDQELALTAMWAILSDLEWPGACYSFVSDRARLTTKPASQTPAPRIGPRTLGLLLGLATMCQTEQCSGPLPCGRCVPLRHHPARRSPVERHATLAAAAPGTAKPSPHAAAT